MAAKPYLLERAPACPDADGVVAEFYARVASKWGFSREESALAVQLRTAAAARRRRPSADESFHLFESEARGHLETACSYLRAERAASTPEPRDLDPCEQLRALALVCRFLTDRLTFAAALRRAAKAAGESEL